VLSVEGAVVPSRSNRSKVTGNRRNKVTDNHRNKVTDNHRNKVTGNRRKATGNPLRNKRSNKVIRSKRVIRPRPSKLRRNSVR